MTPTISEAFRKFKVVCKAPDGLHWVALVITSGGQDLYALGLKLDNVEAFAPFVDGNYKVELSTIWRPADLYAAFLEGIAAAFSIGILVRANSDRIIAEHPEWRALQAQFVDLAGQALTLREEIENGD